MDFPTFQRNIQVAFQPTDSPILHLLPYIFILVGWGGSWGAQPDDFILLQTSEGYLTDVINIVKMR